MPAATARIILSFDKEKAFLEMLVQFDFVKVESKEELLRRFTQNAPPKVLFTEVDVVHEMMEHHVFDRIYRMDEAASQRRIL